MRLAKAALFLCLAATPACADTDLDKIQAYIRKSWTFLLRTHGQLVEAAHDPKLGDRQKWPVYVSRKENLARIKADLAKELSPDKLAQLDIRQLGDGLPSEDGLLYLPKPYVVPGGRFNEMYGWDSYFIELGLLFDGEKQKALDIVDNFLYEVEHYQRVLNANRTYYLTRSQPPFLSRMVLELKPDDNYLRKAWPALKSTYEFWNSAPHRMPSGVVLSRYADLGEGPASEVLSGEKDEKGRTHYDRIRDYFRAHSDTIAETDIKPYYDRANNQLTPLFYKGDRSMRESGFDPSNRFGPFNIDVLNFYPVELNSLLWLFEKDMIEISARLGKPTDVWEKRAAERAMQIQTLLWDEKQGLYLDYQFAQGKRRNYPFGTTFFPLWVGLATPEQAARIVANLPLLERDGGLLTSPFESGNQWDAPFGWAPLQMVAVEGLRKYGYNREADRIAVKWLALVGREFLRTGIIVEKYDVVHNTSQVSANIHFGYTSNEIGFGWTNAAFQRMLDRLSPEARASLEAKLKN